MLPDLRSAVRSLLRRPALFGGSVAVLAVGIALQTAVFGLVNAAFLHPLPVQQPDRLRFVYALQADSVQGLGLAYSEFLDFRSMIETVSDVAATAPDASNIRIARGKDQELVPAEGEMVTANYFRVLGISPLLGRVFVDADDRAEAAPVVVISHQMWQVRFHSDPQIVGKLLTLLGRDTALGYYTAAGRPYTVVGVMPKGFSGMRGPFLSTEYWVPALPRSTDRSVELPLRIRGAGYLHSRWAGVAILRLRANIAKDEIRAAVGTQSELLRRRYHAQARGWSLQLADAPDATLAIGPGARITPVQLSIVLLTVSTAVLLIAVTNVVSILLARSVSRRGEMAVRLAVGAQWWQLLRPFMLEAVLIVSVASGIAFALARALLAVTIASIPAQLRGPHSPPLTFEAPVDWHVTAFAVVTCLIVASAVGTIPARQAQSVTLVSELQGNAVVSPAAQRRRFRQWILVPQFCSALALVLFATAAVRNLVVTELVDQGYDTSSTIVLQYDVPLRGVEEVQEARMLRQHINSELVDLARGMPGVAAVAVTDGLPTSPMSTWLVSREGFEHAEYHWVSQADVLPDYFNTVRLRLIRGRLFTNADLSSAPVAVLSEDLARSLWPDADALGREVALQWPNVPTTPKWLEVVGVVSVVRSALSAGESLPFVYLPGPKPDAAILVVRAQGETQRLVGALRAAVQAESPAAVITEDRSMNEILKQLRYPRRVAAQLLLGAGVFGLMLAAGGLFGVMAHSVAQRRPEIGLRIALGASPARAARGVLADAAWVAAAGSSLGVALALTLARIASGSLGTSSVADAPVLEVTVSVFLLVIITASVVPWRRAVRMDPSVALRQR